MCVREIFRKPNNFCVDVCRCVVVGNIIGQTIFGQTIFWGMRNLGKRRNTATSGQRTRTRLTQLSAIAAATPSYSV